MTFKEKTRLHINDNDIFNKLCLYVEMLEMKNKHINLTGFSGDTLWEEGIYESIISLETEINTFNLKLLDIGAGAGFPSVPFIIAHPEIQLTIYEPISKRVDFLNEVSRELSLNIEVKKIRVEDSKEFEKFDLITARAVVNFKCLLEASHHIGKIGSKFIFIKGPKAQLEIDDSNIISKIFSINPEIKKVILKSKNVNLIVYSKDTHTPKGYPRNWSIIKNS